MNRWVWQSAASLLALLLIIVLWTRDQPQHEASRPQKRVPPAKPERVVDRRPTSTWPPVLSADADPAEKLPAIRPRDPQDGGTVSAAEAEVAGRCANSVGSDCSFTNPSQEELVEMARCATVKFDAPEGLLMGDFAAFPFPQSTIEAASISEPERALILQATEELRADVKRQLEDILLDLGTPRQDLTEMPLDRMKSALQMRGNLEERERAHRQIARARAGLDRPFTPRTATEKAEHLLVHLGDTYEQKLAQVLGRERAAELRAVGDGWSHRSVVATGPCDPPNSP